MNFADLDSDTKAIIITLCENTGWTKPKAILALVEFGMVGMMAAICPDKSKKDKMMQQVYDAINKDSKLKKTAEELTISWAMDV